MEDRAQQHNLNQEVAPQVKKEYKTPHLVVYGTISQLTAANGNGAITDPAPGNNGRNKST
jgi:hypothetical protein